MQGQDKMLDGDQSKSEEERIAEIKFEIKRLFDALEPEVIDPALAERYAQQRKLVITLLSQTNETINLPTETRKSLNEYHDTLDAIADETTDSSIYELMKIKTAISVARAFYDAGKIDAALDILDDPEDTYVGIESQSRHISDHSEAHSQVHRNVFDLIGVIISELHSKKE